MICKNEIHAGLNVSQRPIARLGTNFCIGCLINRLNSMEEEEEERENSLSHKNNLLNGVRRVIIQSDNKEYDNINLMEQYLSEKLEYENPMRNNGISD